MNDAFHETSSGGGGGGRNTRAHRSWRLFFVSILTSIYATRTALLLTDPMAHEKFDDECRVVWRART